MARQGQAATTEDASDALRRWRLAILDQLDSADACLEGAELLRRNGEHDEAARWACRARMLAPQDPRVLLAWARLHVSRGQFDEAVAVWQRELEILDDPVFMRDLGACLLTAGLYEQAEAQFTRLLRRKPGGQARRYQAAGVRLAAVDATDGVDAGLKGLARRGRELLAGGRPSEARAVFEALAQARPAWPAAWVGLDGALHARGEAPAPVDEAVQGPLCARAVRAIERQGFGARGLPFDPRRPVPLERKLTRLPKVATAEALRRTPNCAWVIDPGGRTVEHDPIISLEPDGSDVTPIRFQAARVLIGAMDDVALVGRGVQVMAGGYALQRLLPDDEEPPYWRATDGHVEFDSDRFLDGMLDVRYVDQPVLQLVGRADASFGDWMCKYIPRLAYAAAAGLDCGVVVSADLPEAFVHMLEAFGFGRDRIIFHNPLAMTVFRRLYVTSSPRRIRVAPAADWTAAFAAVKSAKVSPVRPRLYISRRGVGRRQLLNEEEVETVFARRGFQVVRPEQLSLEDTLELFADPAIVAGAYGSGLRNLAFCREKPVGFVLLPPYPSGFHLGSAIWLAEAGIRFGWMAGRSASGAPAALANYEPWVVDVAEVERKLDRLLDGVERA